MLDKEVQEGWMPARLLPTAGIRGQQEQERRAASALLAVMEAVPDFCHGLLSGMKAPKGAISTYTELRFKDEDQRTHIPDGAVIVERGKKRWACLVEIKTNGVALDPEQISRYLDLARGNGFDGLLTISNEIRGDSNALPYRVRKQKLNGLAVYHLSWWRILTEAIVQHRFRGIGDRDQAWILNELIRYLDDESSGASGFQGMGPEWVRVRESVRNETLRTGDPEARAVSARWEQFAEYLCLHLSQELGVDVKHLRSGGRSPEERIAAATKRLAAEGELSCSIRVPDAVGPIGVSANLRTRRVTTTVELPAPREGRAKTRINWLLRQLSDAPEDLRIDVRFPRVRATCSELLCHCRDAPEKLLVREDPKREPRSFILAMSKPMGKKNGRGGGSFVGETRHQVTEFYGDLVQGLVPPRARAPKIRAEEKRAAQTSETPAPERSEGQARREHEPSLQHIAEIAPLAF